MVPRRRQPYSTATAVTSIAAKASSMAAPITSPVMPPSRRTAWATRSSTTTPPVTPSRRTATAATSTGIVEVKPTPRPSGRAAGTRVQQAIQRAQRERQTRAPATSGSSARAPRAAACTPATTTVARTPAGPLVPDFITASERSRSYDAVSPSTVSERPSQWRAREPAARTPTARKPVTSPGMPSASPTASTSATVTPRGSTASGASRSARRAVERSTCRGGATGSAVSVPTARRQASGIGDELGQQGHVAQHGDRAAQQRHRGDGAAALAEPQPEVEQRLEAQLREGQRLGRLGGAVAGGVPSGGTRLDPGGRGRAGHRPQARGGAGHA